MTRLAFSTLGCPGWTLEQVVDGARRYGYDGVELRLLDGEPIGPELPAGERARVRRAFAGAGLPVCCLDTSVRVATGEDPDRVAAELRALLALASEWEAPLLRVFPGPWPEGRPAEAVYDGVAALLNGVTPEAERRGVAIVIETHDSMSSARAVAEALRRVPSPACGALWDTHHPFRVGERPEEVLDLLGDRILHCHVKDARRDDTARTGWDLVLLGEGEVPVRASLDALLARGYAGWVSVEWEKKWHPHIPEPEVALPQHAAVLRDWLGARAGAGAGG
jgi:sugar phosphate isomerase/epimerase